MTTPLDHEPMPGDGTVPTMSLLADRLYNRLPEVYRTLDATDRTWTFKRYLAGMLSPAADVDDLIVAIAGERPVGPPLPEPWGLPADELTVWRENRHTRPSALGDAEQAEVAWLPWLAQMVGARLDPGASEQEKRDTIRFTTSSWRAGTRQALVDAARSALTGSRYAVVVPHQKPDVALGLIPGTPWDITIVTRTSETPDAGAVLAAILRKGVKPAGAVLYHRTYESSWDAIESTFPTWDDWESHTWDEIEEGALTYGDVEDNLFLNPSFETGTTGWSPVNDSVITQVTGGVDSVHAARVTSGNAATASGISVAAKITGILDEREYSFSASLKPSPTLPEGTWVALWVDWYDAGDVLLDSVGVSIGQLDPGGGWLRFTEVFTSPENATKAVPYIDLGTYDVGEYVDVDSMLFRLVESG